MVYDIYYTVNKKTNELENITTIVALPRVVSFFVFIIFAANSRPVDFCTHLFTMENAPLNEIGIEMGRKTKNWDTKWIAMNVIYLESLNMKKY